MLQIAHRGYSGKYGDNNMNSFRQALAFGFDMIELDIQQCSTGEIIIYHDTYIDNKYISELPYDTLSTKGIILLEDFFEEFANKDIKIFLDIKGSYLVIYPLCIIIDKWFSHNTINRLYISGFDRCFIDHINHFREFIENGLHIGFTTENLFPINQLEGLIAHCSFVCFHWTSLDHSIIRYLQDKNILVFAYTCKDTFILNHMLQYKLDGIVSNYSIVDDFIAS